MNAITIGSDFYPWKIKGKHGEGPGYMDFAVAHNVLGTEALLRAFSPDFHAAGDLGKGLRHFLKSLATITHPAVPPVLDVGFAANPDGSESPYVVLDSGFTDSLAAKKLSATPMATRQAALPFLYAMARFLLDAQSLRLGCDFLGPEDIAWDGTRIQFRTIRWMAVFEEGKLPSQHGSLFGVWEKIASSGIYPVAENRGYPRVPSLVCLGRLMYQAAGIPNPVEQVQSLKQEGSDISSLENTRSQLLVDGWGCALEALARRCLFAYDSGMLENAEALLDATERLMKGEVPELCRYVPMAPASAVPSAIRSEPPIACATSKTRQQTDVPRSESEKNRTTPSISDSATASIPVSPSPKPFVPLGMEATMLDTRTSPAVTSSVRRGRQRRTFTLPTFSAQTLRKTALGAGILVGAVLLVWGAITLFSGGDSGKNQPPVAAIAPLEGSIKRFQAFALDGSGSFDPNNDPLIYQWSVIEPERADCSIAENNSQAAQQTTIKFFRSGRHVIQLRVFDGRQFSEPALLEINVQ